MLSERTGIPAPLIAQYEGGAKQPGLQNLSALERALGVASGYLLAADDVGNSFGPRLEELRKLRGLSQNDLARELGVTKGAVHAWEAGRNQPRMVMARRVADLLGVPLADLLPSEAQPAGVPSPVPDGPPSLPMRVAERFRAAREARGLSVADVKHLSGCPTHIIERLETGDLPNASILAMLAASVGVSLDALFGDDPPAANGHIGLRIAGYGVDDRDGGSSPPDEHEGVIPAMPHVDPWVMLDRLTQSQSDMAQAAKTTAQALQDFVRLADKREDNITAFREAALSQDADRPGAPVPRAQNE